MLPWRRDDAGKEELLLLPNTVQPNSFFLFILFCFFPSLIEFWNFSGNLDFHKGSLVSSAGAPRLQPTGSRIDSQTPGRFHSWYLNLSITYYPMHRLVRLLDPTTPTKVFLLMDGCQIFVFEVGQNEGCLMLPLC